MLRCEVYGAEQTLIHRRFTRNEMAKAQPYVRWFNNVLPARLIQRETPGVPANQTEPDDSQADG